MTAPLDEAPAIPGPDRSPRRPALALPPLSCDTHAHVFGPAKAYPYSTPRSYTPPDSPLAEYLAMHDTLGVQRGVLVQPSVYGTDNTAMMDALSAHPDRLRGVAVVDLAVSQKELEELHAGGVRGLRINVLFKGGVPISSARGLADRIAALGWHLQFLIDVGNHPELDKEMGDFPCPVVIDHMGHCAVAKAPADPGFNALLRLLDGGNCWVKLSGPYRITGRKAVPFDDVTAIARTLAERRPDRMVWGTDWPHPSIHTDMPNDGDLVDMLADWVPDAETRRRILVDNPAQLYDFPR
ncbi:amidohydrolase family protein [Oceanibaculum pacificum]|uniref:GntR family transcriptional regulator n=1 Tax=Oceanibaculum pacificum TaxID=580166 RepID=A0A154W6B6_9PROT|nr:amidohydrolase family protein [Oceanibaculum pacificum]KZD09003.1 GntR family transcriptional regulator [Oceanibaculum pacificum]